MGYGLIVLAAGHGKRMQSRVPKVLHKLADKPMLLHCLSTAAKITCLEQIVIVAGENMPQLQPAVRDSSYVSQEFAESICWAHQVSPLGTADAIKVGLTKLNSNIDKVLILSGDVPLIQIDTLMRVINNTPATAIGLVTASSSEPAGSGRIVRDEQHNFVAIIEETDASEAQKNIREINGGVYLLPTEFLVEFLPQINNHNQQQEYYLTDIFKFIRQQQVAVYTYSPDNNLEIVGINSREQLVKLEREYQLLQAKKFLQQGVTIVDPKRFDVRGNIEDIVIAPDVEIDINVVLVGKIQIGAGTTIGPNCYLKDVDIGENVSILANTVIEGAMIEQGARVGPFARIRPNTTIATQAKVGNFVEVKSAVIGEYSKVNHLSYVGDSKIASRVNFGAGSITCNYDGANKHQTIIGDNVSIGAGCQLIAPVTVAANATIGAGTTLVKDAPNGMLTLNKKIQYSVDWQRPTKLDLSLDNLDKITSEIIDK
jgi:bifunctional UDP-N-acetylglucosamine pyrophosphorylase/glucosamine-1-phosphate N-acetyltransferase